MRISLIYKILFFLSLIVLTSVIVMVVYTYVEMEEIIEEQIRRSLINIAESSEGQMFLLFEKFKIRTADWSSDGFIQSEFEEIIKSNDSQRATRLSEYIKTKKQVMDPNIMITEIFNLNGTAIVSTFPERIGHTEPMEELDEEYRFIHAKSASFGETFVSNLVYEDEIGHNEPMWHVSVPIVSLKTNEVIGVMTNHILGKEFYRVLSGKFQIEQGAKIGELFFTNQKTSEIYLVNEERLMVTPSRFVEDAVLKQKIDTEPIKKCFEENLEINGIYKNYLGKEVVGASMCLKDGGLTLVVEIEKDELLIELKEEKNHIILFGIAGWLASIFVIYWIVRFSLNNLLKIRRVALESVENNFNVKVEVKSKDEIGDLAETFNNMLDNIKIYQKQIKQSEIQLKETNLSLEQKIKERTVELEGLKIGLEKTVAERTKEVQIKLAELEKFKKLTIGRELKMVELKEEIEELKKHD